MSDALGLFLKKDKKLALQSNDVVNCDKSTFLYEKIDKRYSFARCAIQRELPALLGLACILIGLGLSARFAPWAEFPLMLLGMLQFIFVLNASVRRKLWCGRIGLDDTGIRFSEAVLEQETRHQTYPWSQLRELSVSPGPMDCNQATGHVLSFHLTNETKHIPLVAFHPHELKALANALYMLAPEQIKDELELVLSRACCIRDAQIQQDARYLHSLWDGINLPANHTLTVITPLAAGDVVTGLPIKTTINRVLTCGGLGARYDVQFDLTDDAGITNTRRGLLLQTALPQTTGNNTQLAEAFIHRAQLLDAVQHPLLAKPVAIFAATDCVSILYDYFDGTDLRNYTERKRRKLPHRELLKIAAQLLQIVASAHSQSSDISFGDLSPESIIFTGRGEIMLLAISGVQPGAHELNGIVIGKPEFIAREQICHGPSQANDLYSVAAILHYALTGCEPDVIGPLHPGTIQPKTPIHLDATIARATARIPENRFLTASQFEQMLLGEAS
jgi:hypothetical protein